MSKAHVVEETTDLKAQRVAATEGLILLDSFDEAVTIMETQLLQMRKASKEMRTELLEIQKTGKARDLSFDSSLKLLYHEAADLRFTAAQPLQHVKKLLSALPDLKRDLFRELWRKAKQALELLFMA